MGRTQKENKTQENRGRPSHLCFRGVFLAKVKQERVVGGPASLLGSSWRFPLEYALYGFAQSLILPALHLVFCSANKQPYCVYTRKLAAV